MFYFLSRLLVAIVPGTIFYNVSVMAISANELPDLSPLDQQITSSLTPTDWKIRSFKSLISRYDCLSGFTDPNLDLNRPIDRQDHLLTIMLILGQNLSRNWLHKNPLLPASRMIKIK